MSGREEIEIQMTLSRSLACKQESEKLVTGEGYEHSGALLRLELKNTKWKSVITNTCRFS